ncbi:MAG TPA: tRNA 5-methoxyuridine(34)/uridine 5-oxyacetic acid(34) synthase CmoB [Chromatiales bacterium]|nr:tRNA 5-methoxyuridine(34)/uridine 5-oxyacetic acid(34) synthase CmoB [Chromatiales bacterium]
MEIADYLPLLKRMEETPLRPWRNELPGQLESVLRERPHGDLPKWRAAIAALPQIKAGESVLNTSCVGVHTPTIDEKIRNGIEQAMRQLHPWRKGPYCIHGVHIDTEWRSDWKWDRLKDYIEPLEGRLVLDVGCGNGYHCWRMAGEGAGLVIGVDPGQLFVMQYWALRHFLPLPPVYVLPLRGEQVPPLSAFDTVFSMGVLYHRRLPLDHLRELHDFLRPGGELVLETLVVADQDGRLLKPKGRYAQMRNVWSIPSTKRLMEWLVESGFCEVRLRDVTATTTEEQRSTDWMRFHSLKDFLDPHNPALTVEGLPAPIRAIVTAKRP